jgi:hypothetical protein
MAGVRDGLVAASCTVDVRFLMAAAVVIGRAVRRIHGRGINRVFVHVVAVNVVKVAIVKIVPVTLVPDCGMPAPKPVRMAVAVVLLKVLGHCPPPFSVTKFCSSLPLQNLHARTNPLLNQPDRHFARVP